MGQPFFGIFAASNFAREQFESDHYWRELDARSETNLRQLIESPENVGEAMAEMSIETISEITAALVADDSAEAGRILQQAVIRYWAGQANSQAVGSLENDCPRCFGRGCRKCDEDWDE